MPRPLHMKPMKLAEDTRRLVMASETVIIAPKYRKGVPCGIPEYCSRDFCKGRVSGQYAWQCFRKNHCHRRGYFFENEDIPIGFCYNNHCQSLMQSEKGSRIVCEKFLNELKHQEHTAPPSGHTTLRLRWKESGWTYRKV